MTAAVTPATGVNAEILKDGVTLEEVLKAARALLVPQLPSKETPLPKSVTVTPEVAQILKTLVGTLENVPLPTARRQLTESELEDTTLALQDVSRAKGAIETADKKIKQVFQTHFDAVARQKNQVTDATKFNKDGFLVLGDVASAAVDDLDVKAVRVVVDPTPVLTEEDLRSLESSGFLTHTEYLAATKPVRVMDEEGVMKLVRERPGLLPVLAGVAKSERDPHTQIRLAPNKD